MILPLLLTTSQGYSQDKPIIVTYNNQTRYCLTESQALLVVSVFDQSEVHKGIIIDLESKVETLESKLASKDFIIEAVDTIAAIEVDRTELSKQEVRKLKRDKVKTWFKNQYDKILYAAGGLSVGVGIGAAAGFSK